MVAPLFLAAIPSLLEMAGKLFDRVIPDKVAAQQAKDAFAQVAQSQEFQIELAQIAVNAQEAASPNWFVAGWRPFVGWTCAVAYAYAYILLPFLMFFAYWLGSPETVKQLALLPKLDLASMIPLLFGMLGLGALRTTEKVKDAEGNR